MSNSTREGNTSNIRNIIQGGRRQGMQLMDAVAKYLDEKKISGEEAYMKATERVRFAQYAPAE